MKFYCGIDLGARKTHVCLIDEDDHKMLDMKMDNNLGVIECVLRPYKSSLEMVAESTINWEWLVYSLQKYGYEVTLAHRAESNYWTYKSLFLKTKFYLANTVVGFGKSSISP
jgi:hypothetical protein